MSGTNPFRRKDNTANLTQAELRFPPIDTDVPKVAKGKTVRIISPHYSRAKEAYDISPVDSPPLRAFCASPAGDNHSSPLEEPSPVDPFNVQPDDGTRQDDDEDFGGNTMANAAASGPAQVRPNVSMPVKPAVRAPALQFGGDRSALGVRLPADDIPSAATANRLHYDVDDFKRLLLTGEKLRTETTTSASIPPAQGQGLQLGDSNSSTDASSVSRQSIFEPHPEVHPESPSTSMDVPLSDEERHSLVQSPPATGRNRPSVPPSHHGKLVKQQKPQTVAFDSLSSSPPGRTLQSMPSAEVSSPSAPNALRHLNKPLPPPPRAESTTSMEPVPDPPLNAIGTPDESSAPPKHLGRVASKRSPPALPSARRQGQGRSRSSTNESIRSTSISEELSQYTHPSPSNSVSTASSKPPPLPPPRRAGTNQGQENADPSLDTILSSDSMEPTAFKLRPPAPPSRTPSTTSVKRLSRISSNAGSTMPAPPPPPRRRGSSQSQSNFTPSRLSGEYRVSSNERAGSGLDASSTQQLAVLQPQTKGKDVMADLTNLQREVDELRGRFGR
ncbi:MAG: hypothetical protein LQ346_000856 [Caloplaca aetnensis]|nr:MAG: hypothetical protein LQ346_000856 [Caloplaca aetnensis]